MGVAWKLATFVVVTAVIIAAMSPRGVTPPFVPVDSYVRALPPWPLVVVAGGFHGLLQTGVRALTPPRAKAMELISSYWRSEITMALIKNGVIDALPSNGTPMSVAQLAEELGLQEKLLARYLRAAVGLDLVNAAGDAAYGLTAVGRELRADAPTSMQSFARTLDGAHREAWHKASEQSLRSGRAGFEERYEKNFWEWHAEHPELEAEFADAMTSITSATAAALIADFEPPLELGGANATVCDIGGGQGTLLAHWLLHHPNAAGKVFDLPTVTPLGTKFLAGKGLSDRAQAVGGSFLDPPLPEELAACDVFVMKHILHDWQDDEAVRILHNIRGRARPGSVIVNVDFVLGLSPPTSSLELTKMLMDINMLVHFLGAQERTFPEFQALFARAGIQGPLTLLPLRDVASAIVARV